MKYRHNELKEQTEDILVQRVTVHTAHLQLSSDFVLYKCRGALEREREREREKRERERAYLRQRSGKPSPLSKISEIKRFSNNLMRRGYRGSHPTHCCLQISRYVSNSFLALNALNSRFRVYKCAQFCAKMCALC